MLPFNNFLSYLTGFLPPLKIHHRWDVQPTITKTYFSMFIAQACSSAVQWPVLVWATFLWLQKLKRLLNRTFTQFPQILAKVHCASSTVYFTGIGWPSFRCLFYESVIFDHRTQGMYPPSWAGPGSEKNFPYFIF